MNDWRGQIRAALDDFLTVAALAHCPLARQELHVEFLAAPHTPPARLPADKMAVYGFWYAGEWLKIGLAGPKSQARYTGQHYSPAAARSTLAKSLLQDPRMRSLPDFTPDSPGEWIKRRTCRVNILLPQEKGKLLLALLEAFLHARLKPRYER